MKALSLVAAVCAICVALAVPAASHADHIGISAAVTARLLERIGPTSWRIEIRTSVVCIGARAGGSNFSGVLHLVELETGKEYFLGGTAGSGGASTLSVDALEKEHTVAARLKISCWEDGSLHGAGPIEASSNPVLIPARYDTGEGGPDETGGGAGGASSHDPTEPLASGGCSHATQGTDDADDLAGSNGGDVIFGYGGADRIDGRSGHDCLLGGRGNDALVGGGGNDRLTGGSGNDTLKGGPGTNAYDAGSGNDLVEARNGKKETVRCGSGNDRARVDKSDRVSGCERVTA
jgi:hypothetical protein